MTGIDAAQAERIVNARPSGGFRDRDDFTARLGADGASVWHRLSSAAGNRLVF
jgi:type II secretory pathway component PulK